MNNAMAPRITDINRIAAYPATRGVGAVVLPTIEDGHVPFAARLGLRIADRVARARAARTVNPVAHAA